MILAIGLVGFVVVALVKPWPTAPPDVGGSRPISAPADVEPSPTADPIALLRRQCEEPLGWRVYTIEEWPEGIVFVWRSLQPAAAATGPLDPSIPVIELGPITDAVGYCSPWSGSERPPAGSVLSEWWIRGPAAGSPEPLVLPPAATAPKPPTALGALFAPPLSSGPATGATSLAGSATGATPPGRADGRSPGIAAPRWPQGRYVFLLSDPPWSRWWSVAVPAPTSGA